jgi:hypothetical protein
MSGKKTENILEILCIKTNKGCFISDNTKDKGYYYSSPIPNLLFNGNKPTDTYSSNWFYIEQYPTSIQKEVDGGIINVRYELKDETLESEKMPKIIPYEEEANYNSDVISGLYSYKYDKAPSYLEDVSCDIQVVCEITDYNFPPKIEYAAIEKRGWNECTYTIKNTNVQHQMLDKIIFPAVLLHERPCKFTSKQMYDMTRQYIISHIDNAVAKITSNYDFCFEVHKLIPKIEPETITYQNIFARTKRERNKVHTTIKKYEEKKIFEMTHDQSRYNNYTVIPEMYANNEAELKEKVDTWLESLIEIINEPLHQCPHCQGSGYIGEIKKEGFSYNDKKECI